MPVSSSVPGNLQIRHFSKTTSSYWLFMQIVSNVRPPSIPKIHRNIWNKLIGSTFSNSHSLYLKFTGSP